MGDDSARLPPIDGVGATVEADVTVSRTSLRWADGRVVARDSPRLSRALRATGVLWEHMSHKVLKEFKLEYGIAVPDAAARMRLEAYENTRQANVRLVVDAREDMVKESHRVRVCLTDVCHPSTLSWSS